MGSGDRGVKTIHSKFNFLFSFPVIARGKRLGWFLDIVDVLGTRVNIMIDSGAYTNRNVLVKSYRTGEGAERIVLLPEYEDFLKHVSEKVWGYVNLDVIGDPIKTHRNYLKLMSDGFTPIPVVTPGISVKALEDLLTTTKRITVASSMRNSRKVLSHIDNIVHGKVRVHLLGYSKYPAITYMPVHYCDSSSFMSGGLFGSLVTFNTETGMSVHSLKSDTKKKGAVPDAVLNLMMRNNVRVSDIGTETLNKGSFSVVSSISVNAYIQLHEALTNAGIAYFFSISTFDWMNVILSIMASSTRFGNFDFQLCKNIYEELKVLSKSRSHSYLDTISRLLDEHSQTASVLE